MPKQFNLDAMIMAKLRQISMWWPPAKEAMELARVGNLYRCAFCENLFPKTSVKRDHIEPVIKLSGFNGDWNQVIERMFVPVESYQILCHPCHNGKTQGENVVRHTYRRPPK